MSEKEKTPGQLLQEKLLRSPKNGGLTLSEEQVAEAYDYCENYKEFISTCKTEREFIDWCIPMLEKEGFVPFEPGHKYVAGDRIYINNRNKAFLFAKIGRRPFEEGLHIAAAHIDSPRLDLKPNPLYEDKELALFKTHYYGGIKRYQWTTIPLALHGVVVRKDGTSVTVNVGEDENDPVFCVTDLLPHLAKEQMDRKLGDGIRGEELNILIGSTPFRDDAVSEKVKLNIANILFEKYEITEEDFQSAELTMVPAGKARDVGFDRSLIGSYGHDDRVCAYGELTGILAADPEYTAVACFADKEETGSDGPTGMNSKMLSYFAMDLGRPYGIPGHVILSHSKCISADVNCAVDPTFDSVHEKNNAAYLNYGIVVTKYTGSGGKNSTNDAPAEFVGEIRKIMNDGEVLWQTGELGKVNEGGGGTVAKYISRLGVDTIDVGVPLLSMHAPMEIASKIDIFMMHKASEAFYNAK